MNIAIIGAGNGGQAMAGYFALNGHAVSLYDRNPDKIRYLKSLGNIILRGCITGNGKLSSITDNIIDAIKDAEIIMTVTIANAHKEIAQQLAPHLRDGQIVILNPGRTLGAFVFRKEVQRINSKANYYIAEAQTLIFACRLVQDGIVNIIGMKDHVLLSGLPASTTQHIMAKAKQIYSGFSPAQNILQTSLENTGAILHPSVLIFNAATIERNNNFWFYRDMTEQVASFIERLDRERLLIGDVMGIKLLSINEWIRFAYNNTQGQTLCELVKNNPAYHDIMSPNSIFARQITEDVPTGIVPMIALAKIVGVKVPLLHSILHICEALLGMDLHTEGRTLDNLGLTNNKIQELLQNV